MCNPPLAISRKYRAQTSPAPIRQDLYDLHESLITKAQNRRTNIRRDTLSFPYFGLVDVHSSYDRTEDGVYADELKESSRFYGGIEGGGVGPLETRRGAKVGHQLSPLSAIRQRALKRSQSREC